MRGRKPKPTVLRLVGGNAGKRPINRTEPQPVGELYEPPAWMTDAQKTGWQHAIAHAPKGLLRHLDSALLAIWVVAEDMHREAALKVAKFGMLVQSPKQRTPVQSPYLPIINKQAEIMMRAASELGFTPTSRSRITLGGEGQAKNRFQNNGKRTA